MSEMLEVLSVRLARLDDAAISSHADRMDSTVQRVASGPWSSMLERGMRHVFYGVRGSTVLAVADRIVALHAGDVLVVHAHDRMRVRAIEGEFLVTTASAEGHALIHASAADVARSSVLSRAAALLDIELVRKGPLDAPVVSALTDLIARYAQRGVDDAIDSHVARALALMDSEPGYRWTLAQLAKSCGLSRAQFSRRFHAAVGTSPLRYLARERLRIAARRLMESDDSLARIAAEIGYESEFAFSKAFKRFFGEAPGAFRKRSSAPMMSRAA